VTFLGTVSDRLEAILRLRVRGPAGTAAEFEAVIDTGYTGLLTLPTAAAEALGLERGMGGQATLADGSTRRFDTFAAELEWGGGWRSVVVSALGAEVLVGMRLLSGHELRVQVTRSGSVEIAELPPSGTAESGAAVDSGS
jgi:clan AA aspartic protease